MDDATTSAPPPDPPGKVWVGLDRLGCWCAIALGEEGPETALEWIVRLDMSRWELASAFGPRDVVRVFRAYQAHLAARAAAAEAEVKKLREALEPLRAAVANERAVPLHATQGQIDVALWDVARVARALVDDPQLFTVEKP